MESLSSSDSEEIKRQTTTKTDFNYADIKLNLNKTSSLVELSIDVPLYRDKTNDLKPMETIFGSIMMGCAMGQTCFKQNKTDKKKMIYAAAAIQDTYLITIRRQAIENMLENQVRRIQNFRMQFLKSIPSPDFKLLPRTALTRICDQLEVVECIRGSVIFQQDEEFRYIYFIEKGEFS